MSLIKANIANIMKFDGSNHKGWSEKLIDIFFMQHLKQVVVDGEL